MIIVFDLLGVVVYEMIMKFGEGIVIKVMDVFIICDVWMVCYMKEVVGWNIIKW